MRRQQQGVGSRRAGNGFARVAVLGDLGLEPGDFIAEDELLLGEDLRDGLVDFGRDGVVLRDQIDKRNRLGRDDPCRRLNLGHLRLHSRVRDDAM